MNWSWSTWRPRPETSIGKARTTTGSIVLPISGWVVFRDTVSAVTCTVSLVAPAASTTSTVGVTLTSTVTFDCTPLLNPDASTATSYLPGVRPLKEYVPALLVTVFWGTDVAWLVTVTLAFGTTAPLESVTVP